MFPTTRCFAALVFLTGPIPAWPAPQAVKCSDPLPINPEVITREMKLKAFGGGDQFGPVCHLRWEGGSRPTVMIYGPSAMAQMGRKFTSAKQAAGQYGGESPKGVEPLPGVANGYMVFDPKTPNRRVFVEYKKKVYMIVSQDRIPVGILAKSVIGR
jgi:hypothetical protein